MVDTADFDAFYADARERLLHQCYALTGDLPASQAAVRDAFVAAWHHWRKVSRRADPEPWARPIAWAHAHRRAGARVFHRDKSDDPEVARTLSALGRLSFGQRRVLLLSTLTSSSMEELAREAGLTRDAAERELQSATSAFAAAREIDPGLVRLSFESLRGPVGSVSWPRITIIRRAGTARRRSHTFAGIAGVVALVVGSGAAVAYDGHARPTLAREREALQPTPSRVAEPPAAEPQLGPGAMLEASQLRRLAPRTSWRILDTSQNLEGDGLALPCQQARFADPTSTGALVRTFAGAPAAGAGAKGAPRARMTAYQLSELSRTPAAARRTFRTTVGWFAGCGDDRVQLLQTQQVQGVGDEASLLVLRGWARQGSTMVVGVARTGQVTTTTLTRTDVGTEGLSTAAIAPHGTLLAAAVNDLCGAPGTGRCAGPPTLRATPPVPVGMVPGMISGVDLPPVSGVDSPWVGTDPQKALTNAAATQCDLTVFNRRPVVGAWTRTFLFPQEDLPDTFGLTETVGTLPGRTGAGFVEGIRKRVAACEDRNLGTEVTRIVDRSDRTSDLVVWLLTVEITDKQSVTYQMGVARSGTVVAQVGFTPTAGVSMAPGDFQALVERAQERLPAMPKPKR